jgi:hypothetical protein
MEAPDLAVANAIAERNRRKTLAFRSEQAAERGTQMLDCAGRVPAAFGDLDQQLLAHRAEKYKAAAEADRDAPTSIALPCVAGRESPSA